MHPTARAHYNLEELWGAGEAARARHIQSDH
jgi:ribosome-associated protein